MVGPDESIPEKFEAKDIKPTRPFEIKKASFGDEYFVFLPVVVDSHDVRQNDNPKFSKRMFASKSDAQKVVKKYLKNNVVDERKIAVVCKGCGRKINQKDECLCRPWLCFRCCDCGTDCNLCNCSHKN